MTRNLMAGLTALALTFCAASAHAALLISEVVYNELGSDTTGEWIEIFNTGPNTIDLSNYKIGDEETKNPPSSENGGMWKFPAGASIAANGVQVVAVSAVRFADIYGFNPTYEVLDANVDVPNMTNYTDWANNPSPAINLANGGDQVLLLDEADNIVDMISWGNTTFAFDPALPTSADGQGQQRINPYVDTNTAADWQVSNPVTPGTVPMPVPEPTCCVMLATTLALTAGGLRRRQR